LARQPRRVETLNFHPNADCILASTSGESVSIWDVSEGKEAFNDASSHTDEIHSLSWQPSGKLMATQCKDKKLRLVDARAGKVAFECTSHDGVKDSKVVWVDDGRVLTSGFSSVSVINANDLSLAPG